MQPFASYRIVINASSRLIASLSPSLFINKIRSLLRAFIFFECVLISRNLSFVIFVIRRRVNVGLLSVLGAKLFLSIPDEQTEWRVPRKAALYRAFHSLTS